ncbi:uncharacterized protein [Arachis hypogaea]|uniref:uncharacterized protein isoform X1 n=1 Tax=Arachis hypogaea TaxID=3818 RepID=UPI003B223F65|nr:uncharacterized protein DS421_11g332240 [Arachis hypogaea]
MPEYNFSELPSSITGYSLLHLSRPLILTFSAIKNLQPHIVNWELAGPVTFDLLPHYQSSVYQFQGNMLEVRLKKAFYICEVGFCNSAVNTQKPLYSILFFQAENDFVAE